MCDALAPIMPYNYVMMSENLNYSSLVHTCEADTEADAEEDAEADAEAEAS